MEAATTLALIQAILALVPTAVTAYGEIKGDLSATTQAEVDAAIASAKVSLASLASQVDADLDAASKS